MKRDKREPLHLSVNDMLEPADVPDVVADFDLALPEVELIEAEPAGPLAPTSPVAETTADTPMALPAPSTIPVVAAGPSSRTIYGLAAAASMLWAVLSVYAIGYQWPLGTVAYEPYRLAMLVMFTLGPISFIWIAAYGLSQGLKIAAAQARANTLAEQIFQPAVLAAAEASAAADSVRTEIRTLTVAAAQARAELAGLHDALAGETERLSALSENAIGSAQTLGDRLSHERESMGGLAEALDARSREIGEAITRQAQMVTEASDLAQAQIGEAEATLAASVAS